MIGIEDIYKVIVATTPLYVALVLGYGSVKWWNIFTNEQCYAINLLVCYITLPLFTFEFTANVLLHGILYPTLRFLEFLKLLTM